MTVETVLFERVPKGAIILEGFQGIGLVGTLSAQYIADRTKAKLIGYINSPDLPPMAILSGGEIKHPLKIYKFSTKTQDFIIFESELPLPNKLVHHVAKEIARFAKENFVKEIVSLEGLSVSKSPKDSKVYGISNTEAGKKKLSKYMDILENGIVIGVSAALLMQAKVNKITAHSIMAEAHSEFPDGIAAASVIKKVNEMYGLKIDVEPLMKESKAFEQKLWDVVEKAKKLDNAGSQERPGKVYIG